MNDSVNYAIGGAKVIRLPGDIYNNDNNDIAVSQRYQNRTSTPIYITRRDGVRVKAEPTARFNTVDELRVYVTYTAERDVIKNAIDLLNDSPNSSLEHGKILRSLTKALGRTNGRQVNATVEYIFNEQQLRDAGGRLYVADLDLMFEVEGVGRISHPFSHNGVDRRKVESLMPTCGQETLAFMFKAVDNSSMRLYSDRFINIGGLVFRIPVEQDDAYPTGFHVVSRNPIEILDEGGKGPGELDSTFYTFDEADKRFGLHRTAEEAKVGGPIVEALKEQANLGIARDKIEAIREERQMQLLRNAHQQQKLELEMQLNGSKSFLEYAKVGAGILTAVVGVLTVWQKLASKN